MGIMGASSQRPAYVYQPYPRWKYGPEGASVIVQNATEEASLGPGWYDSPAEVPPKQTPDSRSDDQTSGTTGETSHSQNGVCDGCRRHFIAKRPWQRGCGSPACRVVTSRRRRTNEFRNQLELVADALNQGDVEAALARLDTLILNLGNREVPNVVPHECGPLMGSGV